MKSSVFATAQLKSRLLKVTLELKSLFGYPRFMLKRFSYFVAYLLLVLMPLQALATANMLVCNSIMQSTSVQLNADSAQQSLGKSHASMPCHQFMATQNAQQSKLKSHCKSTCASLCANLCALTAMHVQIQSSFALSLTQAFDSMTEIYASIPQQNLQRPPILFS